MSRKFRLLLIFSIITLIFLPIYSEAVKIATWNILNFPGTTGTSREDDFRKVIDQLDLDILVVQEMLSQDGVNQFLDNILNYSSPGIYEAARFINGPDSDNALFYKKSSIGFISHHQISTLLRDISEYWLEIKEGPAAGTAFGIYSVHLKAGTGTDNEAQREEEATILRNYMNDLPSNSLFFVCGDYNMRSSDERAFEILTEDQADNDGRTKDPINRLGYWHDNEEFAEIHTQSTRTTQFGGGAYGGLDDRFDLILISYELETSERLIYEEGSYLAYGNDGNHLNMAVNEGINLVVSSEIADALHEASDHLPVIIELESPDTVAISGFVKMENDEAVQGVTVTFSDGGGTATTDLDGYYDYSVTSGWTGTATPSKTGYTFSPDYQFYDNITSDQVDQDYVATLLSYTLSTFAYPSGGGTIVRDPDKISYDHGEDVNLTANSSAGYTFNEWSGDVPQGHEEDNPLTITMDSDKSVTANFRAIPPAEEEAGKKDGCFIATAAYGSPLHYHVKILRDFRDIYLMPSKLGRMLVGFYYKYSPFIADFIGKHKALKVVFQISLLPLVALSYSMIHFGPIITTVMLILIFVLPIFSIWFFRRRFR